MKVGIGLPNTVPARDRGVLLEWARRAEAGGFSTLAVLDRLRYDSVDPFITLAAAAAVTERIGLATMIAIGPLRSPGVLAKQAQSLHEVSGGRFTLGLGIGARQDDYAAAGVDPKTRGAALSTQLAHLRDGGLSDVDILVGGGSGTALARMARYADGYAHGGGPPRAFASAATKARAAWYDHGRTGTPALWGQGYLALSEPDRGQDYLRDYYAFTGPFADKIAAGALTSERAIKDYLRGYEEAGCDELVLFPTTLDLADLDRLIEAL
ncbi:alkanesulfonate monooxygenase SsuD/methylene tetrahydromethanopterin reductase-like flavin-dependent oxidoreductase (luciferase family) [Actinokineospora baliensis]|uniref:LLM class flavin-dependent oxidoreductase n=1 Tax=Actinokineospora baliensis TaxID=547056 RepID=UPI0027DCE522|nr:LLM class flavin-dependent oxidoreductase [Actinokineospora baliensis]MBM7773031.1 alkanesulfonate monooxygenase SsuD/methylene tetrahydromethanopterin reductase-like flavin-dependent oxidoreductase (luciferase family) [Actinokineospora baliensis]